MTLPALKPERSHTFWGLFRQRFVRNRLAVAGGIVVATLTFVALFAPLIAPYDPAAIDTRQASILAPPSAAHWFGADDLGRDVLSRMVYGARISLAVGFVAVGIATIIGVAGALAGYFGGFVDGVIMRFTDLMLTIPSIFLILAVIAFLDPSIYNIMAVIGITGWMGVARLIRAEFLSPRGATSCKRPGPWGRATVG